ncbi:Guanylate cyclase soluble subunit beta-2 [Lamellibrachia satsuma]|nr:Guanylate cyclase soluble subunit beta-2 [Lamellibrachia satsuma]
MSSTPTCSTGPQMEKLALQSWIGRPESGCSTKDRTFRLKISSLNPYQLLRYSQQGVPLPTVLEIFGEYFFTYCLQTGYDKMLMTLGDNIETFIQNLDSLHALLSVSYVNMDAPSFRGHTDSSFFRCWRAELLPFIVGLSTLAERVDSRVSRFPLRPAINKHDHSCKAPRYAVVFSLNVRLRCEPDPDVSGAIRLHYYSSRAGLYPIVVGVLKSVGRHIYDLDVKAEVIETNKAEAETENSDETFEHVTFRFFTTTRENGDAPSLTVKKPAVCAGGASDITLTVPSHTIVGAKDFCNIFPFHVAFNKDLELVQCGAKVQTMTNFSTFKHPRLDDLFTLLYPKMPLTFDHINRFINSVYILQAKGVKEGSDELKHKVDTNRLVLKGQMVWLEDNNYMVYIASLRVTSLTELQERGLYLSDIPVYDVTRELVLLNQQRIAEIDIAKKLDQTMAQLKRTSSALEQEKAKTEMLLSQMLPGKIAMQLRDGKKVQAEKFKQVTILFSDIVTFTNIAAAVQPTDIVSMLDEMYSRFDTLTTLHDVYKVETIGDAYMVVGGVPEINDTHASSVANMAIDMMFKAREVLSPATGEPLKIRVGIHTGSVVAGVVGQKMPRYCLFGDTVNTASRMESNGLPASIHCSETTFKALANHDYRFVDRGEIEVKGKGRMHTYFLTGNAVKRIPHSEDRVTESTSCPSVTTIDVLLSHTNDVSTTPVATSTASLTLPMTTLPVDNIGMTFSEKIPMDKFTSKDKHSNVCDIL